MVQRKKQGRIKIRLAKPNLGNRKKLNLLIQRALDSGFLTQGEYVVEFEQNIAQYLGVKHAVSVSSGTAALHLSLIALGIGPGDEVIVPAYTFPATANVVELVGARPVFVDVKLSTYNIDENKIKAAFTNKTKAIIPVHLFGNPADMDPVIKLAKAKGLKVIEDGAAALGSVYKGMKCGTIGDIGCFSFHPRKVITTGEGGMVATNNSKLANQIRILRNHGMQRFNNQHDCITAGFNYRMNELEAALGIIQMQEIKTIIKERKRLHLLYKKYLYDYPQLAFQETVLGARQVAQALIIRLKEKRNTLLLNFLKNKGIETNIGTYALHILRFYVDKYGYKPFAYPNAYELYTKGLALPFYTPMHQKDIIYICNCIKEFLISTKKD